MLPVSTPSKIRPDLLRQINERTIFDLVRRHGQTSRADLTRLTGMSAPTTSKAVANLLRRNLLEEVGTALPGSMGRPVVVYQLARESVQVLGVTLGARTCTVFAARLDGSIDEDASITFPTPATYAEVLTHVTETARSLVRRHHRVKTLGVGITAPGAIDAQSGRVLFSPNLRLLDDTSPAEDLSRALHLTTCLLHDTAASGLAEQFYGIAKDFSDFVRIGIHEAFGVSAIMGRRLFDGRRGLAGELGHVTVEPDGIPCSCGNRGCLETVATDTAFARNLSMRLGIAVDPDQAVQLAQEGNRHALEELHRTLDYLAIGVAAAINIFSPEAVLICSRLFDAGPDVLPRLITQSRKRALGPLGSDCQILRTDRNFRRGPLAAIIDHLTNALGPAF